MFEPLLHNPEFQLIAALLLQVALYLLAQQNHRFALSLPGLIVTRYCYSGFGHRLLGVCLRIVHAKLQ